MRDGLLADMRQGKRVLYLGPNRDQARDVLDQMVPHLRPDEKMRRANGYERVESLSTHGYVRLHSVGASVRGMTVDVVVVDADPTLRQSEELDPLLVCAELIRV